ncbi:MAG: hypothetical protein ABIH99_04185, partial [Candidatus Micrarchaeota archaeon]
ISGTAPSSVSPSILYWEVLNEVSLSAGQSVKYEYENEIAKLKGNYANYLEERQNMLGEIHNSFEPGRKFRNELKETLAMLSLIPKRREALLAKLGIFGKDELLKIRRQLKSGELASLNKDYSTSSDTTRNEGFVRKINVLHNYWEATCLVQCAKQSISNGALFTVWGSAIEADADALTAKFNSTPTWITRSKKFESELEFARHLSLAVSIESDNLSKHPVNGDALKTSRILAESEEMLASLEKSYEKLVGQKIKEKEAVYNSYISKTSALQKSVLSLLGTANVLNGEAKSDELVDELHKYRTFILQLNRRLGDVLMSEQFSNTREGKPTPEMLPSVIGRIRANIFALEQVDGGEVGKELREFVKPHTIAKNMQSFMGSLSMYAVPLLPDNGVESAFSWAENCVEAISERLHLIEKQLAESKQKQAISTS